MSMSDPLPLGASGDLASRTGLWRMDGNASIRCYAHQGEVLPAHQQQPVRWIWLEDTPGMRVRSGAPCPHPGIWTCEEAPGIERAFHHNATLPSLDGYAVTWRLLRMM